MTALQFVALVAWFLEAAQRRRSLPPLEKPAIDVRSADGQLEFRDLVELGYAFGAHRREYWH
jgi:hypothetical protein